MEEFKVGQLVKVLSVDFQNEHDARYENQIAKVYEVEESQDFPYRYFLEFEDEDLNKLFTETPRAFAYYELEAV